MNFLQIVLVISLGVVLASGRTVEKYGEGKRLIKTSEERPAVWMDEEEIFGLIQHGGNFMDITDFDYSTVDKTKVKAAVIPAIPADLKHQATVRVLTSGIHSGRVLDFVRQFSTYHNRFYAGTTGRQSQRWLLSQVEESVKGYPGKATVQEVDHGYLQRSIVARLEGADPTLASEVVILGAHLDSINRNGPSLNAPGADDNASGSVVLLETLRRIIESGTLLQRTVEFQWYAAEEVGLRGSQAIAADYRARSVNVIGMLNLDVVGYYTPGVDKIGVYTDVNDAHPGLMQFLRILTDEYLVYQWLDSECGYSCSDHASWTRNGFPAVMSSEITPHPQMHTVYDIIQNMNFAQVHEFVKLATGFVVELAEPHSSAP